MTKQYLVNQKPHVIDFYAILDRIPQAMLEEDFREIQEEINAYHRKHLYTVRGWGIFTWISEDSEAIRLCDSLQRQLLFRMNYVYDSSGTFGQTGEFV